MAEHLAQREHWNGEAGQRWAEQSAKIDASLASIAEALLARAAPRTGERVLDVGCGCGATSLLLADRVAPGGSVEGVDISAPMLAVARERAAGRDDVRFTEADAGTQVFGPSFDLVFSRFGVMFFEDPVAAFANLRGALAPGGRLAFVCWRALKLNGWTFEPLQAARALLPPPTEGDPNAPGPFAFADGDRLRGILTAAGFADVRVTAHDDVMLLGATPEAAAAHTLQIGPLARAAADLPRETRARIADLVVPVLARHAGPRGIAAPAALWLVDAR
ncbi:MAG TPA: class I SAM-dependent methyltransferase [Kofleriaceae bacterium]|nr:class I SAM-dependent methyltransferase [Kofleriaceae bacterium]